MGNARAAAGRGRMQGLKAGQKGPGNARLSNKKTPSGTKYGLEGTGSNSDRKGSRNYQKGYTAGRKTAAKKK
jgi:hypothetical protein